MAQQTINIGTVANDGTGDYIRDAFDKANDNFTELYAGLVGLFDPKGATDCSANPNYPAALNGDVYLVSVAGKIGGASGKVVSVGDLYIAFADNAGGTEASVGTSWSVVNGNIAYDPVNKAGDTMSGDLIVPAEAYGSGWNASNEVPTKNDVYDKIEALIAVGGGGITALTGDVTASGAGSVAATIAADAVTYAKMQNVSATDKLLGRSTAGAGDVEEITCTAAGRALIDDANAAAQLVTLGAAARTPSIQSVASSATVTPTFADDQVIITAQAAALNLANPTGTAIDGWGLVIRIKDNGTARAIAYNGGSGSQYRAIGVTLPTTTVISKTLYLGMIFNNADTKWDVVAVAQEA